MHYCKNPFDVLDHYDLVNADGEFNEFATVEPLAEEKTDDNKKFCTTKLKIGAKFSFPGFIKACVNFVIEKTKYEASDFEDNNDGNYAQIGSSGYYAKIGSSGNSAKITSEGLYAVVMCAGNNCKARAKKGSFITLAEWKWSEEAKAHIPVNVKTRKVDGKNIKEDTFYKLENGKFVEVGDE